MPDYESMVGKKVYLLLNIPGYHKEENFILPDTVVSGMSIGFEGKLTQETNQWLHLSDIHFIGSNDEEDFVSGMVKKEYIVVCFEKKCE